jgi:O-antigen/teichoic acid export membrane protein
LISSYTSLLDTIGAQAPAFLLAVLYGPNIAGWYALSQRAVCVPLVLIGRSVDQVYVGEASRLIVTGSFGKPLLRLYLNTAKKLLLTGLVFVIPFGLFSPSLFKVVFGPDWLEAGRYTQIMVPTVLTQFVVAPISQILNIVERQDAQFFWVIIWLMSISGSFAIVHFWNLSAVIAVTLFSTAMTFSYLLHFCISVYILKHLD